MRKIIFLAKFATKIGEIDNEYLKIVIQPWLAEMLRIGEGSLVIVDNEDGRFNITRSSENDISNQVHPKGVSR